VRWRLQLGLWVLDWYYEKVGSSVQGQRAKGECKNEKQENEKEKGEKKRKKKEERRERKKVASTTWQRGEKGSSEHQTTSFSFSSLAECVRLVEMGTGVQHPVRIWILRMTKDTQHFLPAPHPPLNAHTKERERDRTRTDKQTQQSGGEGTGGGRTGHWRNNV